MSRKPRRKRVQVGWYCDHKDEGSGNSSHMSSHGKMKRGKWHESYPEPNVTKGLSMLDYHAPKKKPHCPRAVPVYIYIDPEES